MQEEELVNGYDNGPSIWKSAVEKAKQNMKRKKPLEVMTDQSNC